MMSDGTSVRLQAVQSAVTRFVLGALYAQLLAFSYQEYIHATYLYSGYVNFVPADWEIWLAILIAALPAPYMGESLASPSGIVLLLIYTILYVPFVVLGPLCQPTLDAWLGVAAFVALAAVIATAAVRLHSVAGSVSAKEPTTKAGPVVAVAMLLIATVVIVSLAVFGGPKLSTFDLSNVYATREDFGSTVKEQGGPLFAYMFGNTAYALVPFVLVFGLSAKKYVFVLVPILAQLYFFSVSGFKSFLVVPLFSVGVFFGARNNRLSTKFALLAANSIIVLAIISAQFGGIWPMSMMVRRALVLPGVLSWRAVEMFSEVPALEYSYSFLSKYKVYPYDETYQKLLAKRLHKSSLASANVNLFADGFVNFNSIGFVLVVCFFVLLLKYWDWLAGGSSRLRIHVATYCCLLSLPLLNSALPTTILTHGLGLGTILISLHVYWTKQQGIR